MIIRSFTVTNFKKIRNISVDMSGRTFLFLAGKNGAGKSSALDALTVALMGEKYSPPEPIRRGEDSSTVEVQIDGYTITRTWTRGEDGKTPSTLKITGPDGRINPPQAWLNARMGDLTCDPLSFMGDKPEKQAERLRKLTGLDTTALNNREAVLREARLQLGKDGEREGGALATMPDYSDAPAAPVVPTYVQAELVEAELIEAPQTSPASILGEIAAAEVTERAAEAAERELAECERRVVDAANNEAAAEAKIARIRAELAAAEAERDNWIRTGETRVNNRCTATIARDEAHAAVIPTAPLRSRLAGLEAENKAARDAAQAQNAAARAKAAEANAQAQRDAATKNELARKAADEANAKLRAKEARKAQHKKVQDLRLAYKAKTDEIAAVMAERATMLAAAKFPVEGLSFSSDGGVTFSDLPLSQASEAQRIRVSMAIALASNPQIKLVLIRNASLLDEESLAMVYEMAESAGAQVILEIVGSGHDDAVTIVDGGTV